MISTKKLATIGVSAALFASSAMPAFAGFNLGLGNGDVEQSNTANVNNSVSASSNTGGNSNSGWNIFGSKKIKTGNAATGVGVTNVANKNVAVNSCGCNDVNVGLGNGDVEQSNTANVNNSVSASSNTGGNSNSGFSLAGKKKITTGGAMTGVSVTNVLNKNVSVN